MIVATLVTFVQGYAQFIVILFAALTALAGAAKAYRKWVWLPFKAQVKETRSQIQAASKIVMAELTPNGGGSLLDNTRRIVPNHQEAQRHWAALEAKNEEIAATLLERGTIINGNHEEAQRHWTALERGQEEIKATFTRGAEALVQREKAILNRLDKLDTSASANATVHTEQTTTAKTEIIHRVDDLEQSLTDGATS